jgi:hypothetical protein
MTILLLPMQRRLIPIISRQHNFGRRSRRRRRGELTSAQVDKIVKYHGPTMERFCYLP